MKKKKKNKTKKNKPIWPKLNRPPLALPQWWWPKLSPLPPWYSRIHHTIPSSKSIPILVGYFGGDVVEWVILLLLVVVGHWGFRLWVWVEIKSWVWVKIGMCLCLWLVFVFMVGIGPCLCWWLGSSCRRRWVCVCDLSLSLSLWCEANGDPECSWGVKQNKKKGPGHLCRGEKQEKEKRKKRNEMNGRKLI